MKLKHILFTLLSLFILIGCVSPSQPSNNLLNVKVIAGKTSTPLSIHFFTLKSDNVFKRLDYFELVDSKHINWNDELLSRAKTLLLPGHTEIFQVPVSAEMQYYALVIGFKDVRDNDNWRYLQLVTPNGDNVALRLSQESDGYTSRAVQRVSNQDNMRTANKSSSHLNKLGNKISNRVTNSVTGKVQNTTDKAIDRSVNRVFGRLFN